MKTKIKISRNQWERIGEQAGWTKQAQVDPSIVQQLVQNYDLQTLTEAVKFAQQSQQQSRENYNQTFNAQLKEGTAVIKVYWDQGYQDYCVYFPSIKMGVDPDVPDQVIRISDNQEHADFVFGFVNDNASPDISVYDLYKQTQDFIGRYV